MDEKTDLRIKFKALRKTLNLPVISKIITDKITCLDVYRSAKNVMIFYPTKFEIDVLGLLSDNTKNFFLPKISGKELLVCPYKIGDKLIKSSMNIMEPLSNAINPEFIDLVIVPALAVDINNYRLGYGGGFYDRFLSKYKHLKTVTPVSVSQIVSNLPFSDYDRKVDFVITE